jgi:hypothetical protein
VNQQGETIALGVQGAVDVAEATVMDTESGEALVQAKAVGVQLGDVSVQQAGDTTDVGFTGGVETNGVTVNVPGQPITIAQDTFSWNGDLKLALAEAMTLNLGGGVSLAGTNVDAMEGLNLAVGVEGVAVTDLAVTLNQAEPGMTVQVDSGMQITNADVDLADQGVALRPANIGWTGQLTYEDGEEGGVILSGDVSGRQIVVANRNSGLSIVELSELLLREINGSPPAAVSLAELKINGTRAFQRQGEGPPFAVAIGDIAVTQPKLEGNALAIGGVSVNGLDTYLARDKEGALEILSLLPGAEEATAETAEQPAEAERRTESPEAEEGGDAFKVQLGGFELAGDNKVVFRDDSVNPPVNLEVTPLTFSIAKLDMSATDAQSPVKLSAKSGKYSSVEVDGTVAPLADAPTLAIMGKIEAIDMPPLTGYTERYIGYRLQSGLFSADLDVKVDAGTIDADTNLKIQQFELERLKADEIDAFEEQLGLPVNTALSLLRDGEGNIELAIPISGDLSDPSIGIGDVVRQAVMNGAVKAIKAGVMTYFRPVGAAVMVGKMVTGNSLSFQPVEFSPGGSELSADHQAYLIELAKLLSDRPKVSVKLSGIATTADRRAMSGGATVDLDTFLGFSVDPNKTRTGEDGGKSEEEEVVDEDVQVEGPVTEEILLALAQSRAELVKDYLVEQGGLDPARLLISPPVFDDADDAIRAVEIGL